MKKTIFIFFLIFNVAVQAQFTKKMQVDFSIGFWIVGNKEISLPLETSYNYGEETAPYIGELNFWYNINQRISIGLNTGFVGSQQFFYEANNDFNENVIAPPNGDASNTQYDKGYISDYYAAKAGIGSKYNIVDHKKFKFYAKGSIFYNAHYIYVHPYSIVNSGDYPFSPKIYYHDGRELDLKYSFGTELGMGLKSHFSKGFGLIIETSYSVNGFYRGLKIQTGLFFGFINN